MSLFKFQNYSAIKNVKDNPRVKATQITKNGYAFGVTSYTSGGSKSKVEITVAGTTPANGNIIFDIGGQRVYTTIVGATQDTAALVAAEIKASLDAVLLGLSYTVAISSAKITVTAPANGVSVVPVTVDGVNMGESACTLSMAYTAGTDAVSYDEAAVPFTDDAATKAGQVYVAMNIIDKPETINTSDYQVEIGEYVRSINLNNMIDEYVEISSDLCTTAFSSVSVGDKLVPIPSGSNNMKWKVSVDTGFGVVLVVKKKTAFGAFTIDGSSDGGYLCQISSN